MSDQIHVTVTLPRERTTVSVDRRFGGPYKRPGYCGEEKPCWDSKCELLGSQPIHYTDYVILLQSGLGATLNEVIREK